MVSLVCLLLWCPPSFFQHIFTSLSLRIVLVFNAFILKAIVSSWGCISATSRYLSWLWLLLAKPLIPTHHVTLVSGFRLNHVLLLRSGSGFLTRSISELMIP